MTFYTNTPGEVLEQYVSDSVKIAMSTFLKLIYQKLYYHQEMLHMLLIHCLYGIPYVISIDRYIYRVYLIDC